MLELPKELCSRPIHSLFQAVFLRLRTLMSQADSRQQLRHLLWILRTELRSGAGFLPLCSIYAETSESTSSITMRQYIANFMTGMPFNRIT